MGDSLGDRMKRNYENVSRIKLTRRTPVIIRLDGKAFHTLTKNAEKPFDNHLRACMRTTAVKLCKEIQGAQMAYTQSDEISILVTDYTTLRTCAWFDYNVQKMVSISAAFASVEFSRFYGENGYFDARAFNLPKEEVMNYFIWRQQDWLRNSVHMLASSHFSHKELQGKNVPAMHDMLHAIGVNWADLPRTLKNGETILKSDEGWVPSGNYVFTKHRVELEELVL